MAVEIERKFLVCNDYWKSEPHDSVILIRQGYLSTDTACAVRVRTANDAAYLTIKGKRQGLSCKEHEWPIPYSDALELLQMCSTPIITKTRHIIYHNSLKWEVDVFEGTHAGLVMAEVEFPNEDSTEISQLPVWIGREVSYDLRYTNVYIAAHGIPNT